MRMAMLASKRVVKYSEREGGVGGGEGVDVSDDERSDMGAGVGGWEQGGVGIRGWGGRVETC